VSEGDTNLRAADRHRPMPTTNIKVNGNGKVILDTHPESDQHQNLTCSRGSPPAPTHQIWWWSMNPFLRYLADKRVRTDTQTDTCRWPQDLAAYGAQVKTPPMASNYAFHFHLAFNFRLYTLKNAPASGGLWPYAPFWGFAPGPNCWKDE